MVQAVSDSSFVVSRVKDAETFASVGVTHDAAEVFKRVNLGYPFITLSDESAILGFENINHLGFGSSLFHVSIIRHNGLTVKSEYDIAGE